MSIIIVKTKLPELAVTRISDLEDGELFVFKADIDARNRQNFHNVHRINHDHKTGENFVVGVAGSTVSYPRDFFSRGAEVIRITRFEVELEIEHKEAV